MIPDGVTQIGEYAFVHCDKIITVTIPDSVTIIGRYAFAQSSLRNISIPSSVTTIGEAAFLSTSIQSIIIPSSVTSIGRRAFLGCSNLTYVEYWGASNPAESVAFTTTVTEIYVTDDYTDKRCCRKPATVMYYTLSATADPAEGGRISGLTEGKCKINTNISLTAKPNAGYTFVGWTKNSETVSTNNPYEFTMPANAVSLNAVFAKTPPEITGISVTVDGKTYTSGSVTITSGSTVSLTVTGTGLVNLDGQAFLRFAPGKDISVETNGWSVDADGTTATCDLTAWIGDFSACNDFEVTYTEDNYTTEHGTGIYLSYGYPITVTTNGNGTASASVTAAAEGTEVALTAMPNVGYKLIQWQVVSGGVTVENDGFIMSAEPVEIRAVFEKAPDPAVITGVSITVDGKSYTSGNVIIEPDSTVSFTVTGTDLVNLDGKNHSLRFAPGKAINVTNRTNNGWWRVDAYGTTATCDFLPNLIDDFSDCKDFEVKYSNTRNDYQSTGIYLTYCAEHSGGTATCTEKAICSVCSKEYGDYAAHAPDANGKCTVCSYQYTVAVDTTYYESFEAAIEAYANAVMFDGTLVVLADTDTDTGAYAWHGSGFTINSGVTLTNNGTLTISSSLTNNGSIVNNGTLNLPISYTWPDEGITGGTVNIGEKSYTWDSEKRMWICGENSHSYDETTHVCSICGKVETFTVYWAGSNLELQNGISTYGQDFVQTISVPEKTHLRITNVTTADGVSVNYTYENGVLTIAAKDVPAANIDVVCNHYVEVTFHANGGVIKPEKGFPLDGDTGYAADGSYWVQEILVGGDAYLSNYVDVTRTGYTFIDWRDASGQIYPMTKVNGAEFVSATEDVTVSAQWQANTYTVKWDVDGETYATTEQTYDAALVLPIAPTKTGYIFDGWYTAVTSDREEVTAQTVYGTAGESTYYADWTECDHSGDTNDYADNGDGTHDYVCSVCDMVRVDKEKHTFNSATGKCSKCEADMAEAKVTSGGVDTYYETLYAALTAAKNGDTVTLCANVVIGTTARTIPTGVTFEGGEYTLSGDVIGSGNLYNLGTINSGNFTLSVENQDLGIIAGGSFTRVNNQADVKGGSFEELYFNSGSVSGRIQFKCLNYSNYSNTIDLSEALLTGTETIIVEEGFELTASGIKLDTDHFALALADGSIVPRLDGQIGYIVPHDAHSYTTVNDETHHWQVCACGKTTEKVAHGFTYVSDGDKHTVGCSGCEYTKTEDHTLTYSADGSTITASCSANCGHSGSVTITAENKLYDGTAYVANVTKTGILKDETFTVVYSLTKDGQYTETIPTSKNAGDYTVWYYVKGDSNHSDSTKTSVKVTIGQKELTAAVTGSAAKTYDGTNTVPAEPGLSVTLTGIVGADDVKVSASYAYDGVNVGTTKINATGITLSGADADNYTLKSTTASANIGEITQKSVTITAKDQTIPHGTEISNTEITAVGLINGHSVTAVLTPSTANVTVNGTITASAAVITADGTDVSANYEISYGEPAKLVIEPDTSKINGLTTANVTSANEADIKAVQEMMENADSVKDEWAAISTTCENLIDKIEAVRDATDTENTEKVEDVTADNVKPEDQEALKDAKADLEKALEDNAGNYTEEEKKAIQDEIQRIEDAMAALENAQDVTDAITQLPETVEPDDEEAAEKILGAKEAYDELTDHEKSLMDETIKKKLDDLVAALTAYDIIKGDGGKWTKDSSSGLSFTANGPFSKFIGIEVDGKEVDGKYYDVKAGSTIITLKQSFLKLLSTGEHTVTVLYTDGETSGTFKILAASSTPATGDDSNIMLYSTMLTISFSALVILILASKKRKQRN